MQSTFVVIMMAVVFFWYDDGDLKWRIFAEHGSNQPEPLEAIKKRFHEMDDNLWTNQFIPMILGWPPTTNQNQ